MSGHSKWSTIKRKKEATDQARGKLFSKLSKAISIAVKTGGGPNPDSNNKLRVAIDQAKAANMPKTNIQNAISRAQEVGNIEEVTYEGFGPKGINVLVLVATDNRNRTGQEIKNIFERGGGHLAGPGAVSFNFEPRGLILVKKEKDIQEQMLLLIDQGAEDVEEVEDGIEISVSPARLFEIKRGLEKLDQKIISTELVQRPKALVTLPNKEAQKALSFLESLDNHNDVQKVFANLNIDYG